MSSAPPQEALRLAIRHHQAGQLQQAEAIYRQILQLQPSHPDALHLLGVVAHQVGQHETAVELIGKAIGAAAKSPEYHANLGEALRALGRLDEAVASYRRAIRLNPRFASAYNNLGIALKQQGKDAEAVTAYRRAIAVKPGYPQALNNLAIALKEQGKTDEAIGHYRQAIALDPNSAETHNNLGVALKEQGLPDQAIDHFQRALALKPDFAAACEGLGGALRELGRLDAAAEALSAATRLDPRCASAYNNLGVVLKDLGRAAEAIAAYEQAIALEPELAEAHNNLGIVLKEQGRLEEAIRHLNQASALKPGYAEACNNLGLVLEIQGKVEEAIAAYRQAIALNPAFSRAHSNVLFALNYLPRLDAGEIFCEHLRWAKAYADPLGATIMPHANDRTPGRPLRIGYVSPDFRKHPVAYFIESVLACHDAGQFEITCYSDVSAPDEVTGRLRRLAHTTPHVLQHGRKRHSDPLWVEELTHAESYVADRSPFSGHRWRDIYGLTDEQGSALMRQDGIDILIDLAGHTDRNRLLLFALKPAPVQASWIGYFNTSGLAAMDYFISDRYSSPEELPQRFTEQLIRLPHSRFCYLPPDYAPAVVDPPAATNGYITFGCFNNLAKINADVVALWAEILSALPDSRLLLKSLALNDEGTCQRYRDLFSAHGITPDRIALSGHSPHAEMLAQYGRVDIALDPFPFSGGLTTCEALWMGVPVVTLAGETLVSRQSASLLMNLGKTEWVAESPRQYVETALMLAADPAGLVQLRRGLRKQMAASPVCDAGAFTLELESAYRKIWQAWCAGEK